MSISRSRLSLDNSPSSTDSVVEYCSLYTHCWACPKCRWHQSTSIPDPQPGDSALLLSTLPAGVIPLPSFRSLFSFCYNGTFLPSVSNWHHVISFQVHGHLPLALGSISCINELREFYFKIRCHIFFFDSNIQLHTMKWMQYTPLMFTTYGFSSFNNSTKIVHRCMLSLYDHINIESDAITAGQKTSFV